MDYPFYLPVVPLALMDLLYFMIELTFNQNTIEYLLLILVRITAFMTTSPSYIIMASLDYARYYMDAYGEGDYEKLIEIAEKWKEKINKFKNIKI